MRGFYHGIMQQVVPVNFQMKMPDKPDFNRIDSFIQRLLGSAHIPAEDLSGVSAAQAEVASHYADQILRLTSGLQRLGQMPIFTTGRLIEVRGQTENANIYHVKALLPQLDFFPLAFLRTSLAVAASLIHWVAVRNDIEGHLSSAYELVQEKIIRPIQGFADSGVSTLPILQAACQREIPFWHLGHGIYQLGMGSNSHLISRSAVDTDSAIGAQIASKKDRAAQLLRIAGLPVPPHVLVTTLKEAQEAATTLGWPVVVKPTDRERSEGVSTGLQDLSAVEAAFATAQKFSDNILVERHIPGVCFRLMIANKKFLYAVERRPRSVVGNGTDSIRQLLLTEQSNNARLPPWSRKKQLTIDDAIISVIQEQGFGLESVPAAGSRISLKAVESTEWGEMTFDVTDQVAPENIEVVERAAAVLGLNNAGIDMISTDISRPWHEIGAVINEVNFRPHFGGTAAAKARMQFYVDGLINGKGRVPVEVFVGDEQALQAGRDRQRELTGSKARAFLTSHELTWGPAGELRQFGGENKLSERCQALFVDKNVDAIVVVVQTDELLQAGLPVNHISKLTIVNRTLSASHRHNQRATAEDIERIIALLTSFAA